MGYRIELQPVEFINYCVVEMCEHEIFRCNLKNLQFNTPWHLDPVCQRAVQAVTDCTLKFRRARLFNWLSSLLEEQLFERSEYAPKNYWALDIDIPRYSDCTDCGECCGIIFAKKQTDES